MEKTSPSICFFSLTKMKLRLHFHVVFLFLMAFSELHTPVLFREVIDIFSPLASRASVVVDATLGLGGHASLFVEHMSGWIFVGFDRDTENLTRAKTYLWDKSPLVNKKYIPASFDTLTKSLLDEWIHHIDSILYDLGVSSVHLDEWERGFSFRFDWPLDMRFDRRHGKTAADIINSLDEKELARIFTLYGEEKKSWFIALEIVKSRKIARIETTFEFLEIIKKSSFDPKSPLRVFQALRIYVNEEFSHIESSLAQALELLAPGGIIMVITFHSLEDRLVKQFFAKYLEDTIDDVTGRIIEKSQFAKYTKKPIIPTESEIAENPRSRSAKMRVIQKI